MLLDWPRGFGCGESRVADAGEQRCRIASRSRTSSADADEYRCRSSEQALACHDAAAFNVSCDRGHGRGVDDTLAPMCSGCKSPWPCRKCSELRKRRELRWPIQAYLQRLAKKSRRCPGKDPRPASAPHTTMHSFICLAQFKAWAAAAAAEGELAGRTSTPNRSASGPDVTRCPLVRLVDRAVVSVPSGVKPGTTSGLCKVPSNLDIDRKTVGNFPEHTRGVRS